ncbi:hypothetical protein FACS1894107_16230 [Planctomycetales bacterium]|nr:hypothetical protein FACS1894107_16230 [Planctomycetales bacterium]GHS97460.1 hypothetical protein FACS1894108_03870 [Planctomycetales bacterium]
MNAILDAKALIRQTVQQRLARWSPTARAAADRELITLATDFLFRHWQPPALVMAFVPLPDEPDIFPLLEKILAAGYRLGLPVTADGGEMSAREITDCRSDLQTVGKFALVEPKPVCPSLAPSALDVVIVPGRAFTPAGVRLGRGGGCYDRFLPRTKARRLALAYQNQIFSALPADGHDQKVDEIFIA